MTDDNFWESFDTLVCRYDFEDDSGGHILKDSHGRVRAALSHKNSWWRVWWTQLVWRLFRRVWVGLCDKHTLLSKPGHEPIWRGKMGLEFTETRCFYNWNEATEVTPK